MHTTNNTFIIPMKEDVEIVVGDEKQQDFFPRIKIKRWDNEVNFSIGVISAHARTNQIVDNKVIWDDGNGIISRFYEKELDEFEFEIEFATKPSSNIIDLSIETKGLKFFYQPELTQQQIDEGHKRPDNVVGSYAVYHSSMKGNYANVGGKNYRAGKAFHIYRPIVFDDKNKWTWCDMHIDEATGLLSITIPQNFIDTATYPIIVDPTFGCNPAIPGGSWALGGSNWMDGSLFTSPADIDTAQNINAYVRTYYGAGADFHIKGIIVLESNANIITNGIGSASALISSTTGVWAESDFATDPSPAQSTDHVLMIIPDHAIDLAYDAGDFQQGYYDTSNSYATPVHPTDAINDNDEHSIYCTYTVTTGNVPVFNHLQNQMRQ